MADYDEGPPGQADDERIDEAIERPAPREPLAQEGATQLGAVKYVHAAFLVTGVLGAFVSGKALTGIWNSLANWPAAVAKVPFLIRYSEDERPDFTMTLGLLIGIVAVWRSYKNPPIQKWAHEVAAELSKVHWPDKQLVTKGTVVVLVASAFATVYVGLLDQLWGFVTALVYHV